MGKKKEDPGRPPVRAEERKKKRPFPILSGGARIILKGIKNREEQRSVKKIREPSLPAESGFLKGRKQKKTRQQEKE